MPQNSTRPFGPRDALNWTLANTIALVLWHAVTLSITNGRTPDGVLAWLFRNIDSTWQSVGVTAYPLWVGLLVILTGYAVALAWPDALSLYRVRWGVATGSGYLLALVWVMLVNLAPFLSPTDKLLPLLLAPAMLVLMQAKQLVDIRHDLTGVEDVDYRALGLILLWGVPPMMIALLYIYDGFWGTVTLAVWGIVLLVANAAQALTVYALIPSVSSQPGRKSLI